VILVVPLSLVFTQADVAPGPGDDVSVEGEAIIAAESGPSRVTAVTMTACTDYTFMLEPWRGGTTYTWSYNPDNAPASVASTALTTIESSSQTVASGQNRCGSPANLPVKQQFAGTTREVAQVSANASCTGNDGRSVVSWGTLPPSYLAYTCVYYQPSTGRVLSADVLIDNRAHQWFTTPPANCAYMFDLGSVMTHERGHTAGLNHVDQTTLGAQTMSPKTLPCDTTKRLLAAGDLAGLRHLATVR
jgi:hypothetical protein